MLAPTCVSGSMWIRPPRLFLGLSCKQLFSFTAFLIMFWVGRSTQPISLWGQSRVFTIICTWNHVAIPPKNLWLTRSEEASWASLPSN